MLNLRRDALAPTSRRRSCGRAGIIGVEDLTDVAKDDRVFRAAAELGVYEFRRPLEDNAAKAGVELTVADKELPASSLCSACGERNQVPKERRRGVAAGRAPAAERCRRAGTLVGHMEELFRRAAER